MRRLATIFVICVLLISLGSTADAAIRHVSPVRHQPQSLSAQYLTRVLTAKRRLGLVKLRAPAKHSVSKVTRTAQPGQVNPLPRVAIPQMVIPLLAYHHLVPSEFNRHTQAAEVTTPEQFEKDLVYLRDEGYTAIFFGDLLDALDGKKTLPSKPVVVFFDDGYQSNYVYAWPLLKKYGVKATINAITSWVTEKAAPFDPTNITFLSWEQIKEMVDSGVIDIQSHTHDLHRHISGQPVVKLADEQQLRQDFTKSKQLIEKHTGKSVTVLSYPFAAYTDLSDQVGQELFRISLGPAGADAMGKPLGAATRRLNVQYYNNAKVRLAGR